PKPRGRAMEITWLFRPRFRTPATLKEAKVVPISDIRTILFKTYAPDMSGLQDGAKPSRNHAFTGAVFSMMGNTSWASPSQRSRLKRCSGKLKRWQPAIGIGYWEIS